MSGMGGKEESVEDSQSDLCNDLSEGEPPETIDFLCRRSYEGAVDCLTFLKYIPFKNINRAILGAWMMSGMGGKETPPIVSDGEETQKRSIPFCRRSYEGAVD